MNTYKKILLASCILSIVCSCKKQFLNAKPDNSLVVPGTLPELQALLDNDLIISGGYSAGSDPHIGALSTDDYYITDADYLNTDDYHRAAYTWAKKIPFQPGTKNWIGPYRVIFYANIVLDALNKLSKDKTEQLSYNNIKGSALFYRAFQFYNLAQVFAPQYKSNTASSEPGIPLRLTADISELTTRSTVKETYERIISDLNEAIALLPNNPLVQTRPCKTAAFALLARTYLTMQNYSMALQFASSSLELNNQLMDYNEINPEASEAFSLFNKEVLFHSGISYDYPSLIPEYAKIDNDLYNSYEINDLRKTRFFSLQESYIIFKGSYRGTIIPFTGLATDEVYLMQAECYARLGDPVKALRSLNELMINRFDKTSFKPFVANDSDEALAIILAERRKELVMRNMRWTDLRRLNLDPRFAITLTRKANGQTYTLPPNDPRYTLPIPEEIIGLTGIAQNQR